LGKFRSRTGGPLPMLVRLVPPLSALTVVVFHWTDYWRTAPVISEVRCNNLNWPQSSEQALTAAVRREVGLHFSVDSDWMDNQTRWNGRSWEYW